MLQLHCRNFLARNETRAVCCKLLGRCFRGFVEPALTFPPTYKFDAGTDVYDSSSKRRIPSWTDRILFRPHEAIEAREYNSSRRVRSSDHRPVYATFVVG